MISVIGSGRVGASVALQLALREIDDIVLIDIIQGLPQGEALDLGHMVADVGVDVSLSGSNDYRDISGSDIVVVPAGLPRKEGMTRLDLLAKNAEIVRDVCRRIVEFAPNSKVVTVTNPLDVMTYLAHKVTGFAKNRIVGFSGVLDGSRFKSLIAQSLGVSVSCVKTLVIGEHGDSMVPLARYTSVEGIPLTELLPGERVSELIERTRSAGAEVLKLKAGSAHHAPGQGVARTVEAIKKDKKTVFTASALLEGEYGYRELCIGVPVVVGQRGIEKVIELKLNTEEKSLFDKSARVVMEAISSLRQLKYA